MRRKFLHGLLFLFCLCACGSCSKDTTEVDKERQAIETYLNSQKVDYQVQQGVYKYVTNAGRPGYDSAVVLELGNQMKVDYILSLFSGGKIIGDVYTNRADLIPAKDKGDLNTQYWPTQTEQLTLSKESLISGLVKGLPGSREGDTVKLFLPSDLGYGRKPYGVIPANSTLVWTMVIHNVVK